MYGMYKYSDMYRDIKWLPDMLIHAPIRPLPAIGAKRLVIRRCTGANVTPSTRAVLLGNRNHGIGRGGLIQLASRGEIRRDDWQGERERMSPVSM